MKSLILISAFVAIAVAKPSGQIFAAPTTYVIGTPIQQQHHFQDSIGQYAYGYSDGLSAKQESKSIDGVTRGGYSYIDSNGKLQTVSYISDAINGFRVAATNLPKALPAPEPIPQIAPLPVTDTVEVLAARAEHLRAVDEAKLAAAAAPDQPESPTPEELPVVTLNSAKIFETELPKQVEDTPEVAQAKLEHFAAKKEAELRNAAAEINILQPEIVGSLPPLTGAQIAPAIGSAIAPIPPLAPALGPALVTAPTFAPVPSFIQPASYFRGYALPSGFGYSYGYANSPFAWDPRFVIATQ